MVLKLDTFDVSDEQEVFDFRKVTGFMKKRVVAALLCMMTVLSLTGCGGKEGTEAVEGTETAGTEALPTVDLAKYEFNYSDYVTLCDYSAIPVTLTDTYEVTDGDVTDYFENWFSYYSPFYVADDTKTVIEEGDIVDVNYVGKLDGEAFEGGSAENQVIDVSGNCMADGSTGFIDGFTDGLIGASVGEEVDCDVTFPEDYSNTDLAGKAVVFTFTVNSIQREIALDEVDDAFAAEYAGTETLDEMYDMLRENLEAEAEYYKTTETNNSVQDYLMTNCTVEVPEDFAADLFTAYRNMFITQNCNGDESLLESYLSSSYGYTVEEAEANWKQEIETQLKVEFILRAIAEKEGITLDQEGFDAEINDMMSYYGLESADTIYQSYGYGDTAYGEKYMRSLYLANSALDKLKESIVVTVDPGEEAEGQSTESTEETETTVTE